MIKSDFAIQWRNQTILKCINYFKLAFFYSYPSLASAGLRSGSFGVTIQNKARKFKV